jgi:hypothetical protein
MKSFIKSSLIFFFLFTLVNANKLRASPDDEAVFWSRRLTNSSMNFTDFKPELSITSFGVITEDEVGNMSTAWGDTLINISKTYEGEGFDAAKNFTEKAIDKFFCYHLGIPVGLKPSRSIAPQTFRTTPEAALAYYVGNNSDYPNDTGFALRGWVKVENYPATILLLGRIALSMGTELLTNKDGNVTLVDKTWGLLKEDNGNICIMIQHGSVPYSPDK